MVNMGFFVGRFRVGYMWKTPSHENPPCPPLLKGGIKREFFLYYLYYLMLVHVGRNTLSRLKFCLMTFA